MNVVSKMIKMLREVWEEKVGILVIFCEEIWPKRVRIKIVR